ncbi:MAG: hypothetical protein KF678_10855 [Phycisphaeraceae bacterium]|nr:hypothetical protein [Phycisphaeraceae bacterium]
MNSIDEGGAMKTPDELKNVEATLDALGEAERQSAPARLAQGVFLASYSKLRGPVEAPVVRVRRLNWAGLGLKVAAAVALTGVAVGLWTLSGGNRTSGGSGVVQVALSHGLEDDVDFLLDLRSSADDLAVLGERIDTLYLDATSVRDSLSAEPGSLMLGDTSL